MTGWSRKAVYAVLVLAFLAAVHISISKSLKRRAKVSQELSGTASGAAFERWLQAFNGGDPAAYAAFAEANFAPSQMAGRSASEAAAEDMAFREQVGGGFAMHQLLRANATEFSGIAREKSGFGFALITLRLDGSGGRIASLDFQQTPPPPEAAPQRLDEAALLQQVDELATRMAREERFSGVLLIARNGAPILVKEFGLAGRQGQTPNRRDLPFNLASMNKMFTSVAIAQLVQQGKLRYQDTLAKVLPDYPHLEIAGGITVEQLLTHTSGLGDIFGPEFDAEKENLRELRDYLSLFAAKQLRFLPGERHEYSNAGFIVLGLMVEKISGQSYFDYVQAHIYDPAKMTGSGSYWRDEATPPRATGYTRMRGRGEQAKERQPNTPLLGPRGTSAGGGYASALDLLNFAEALRGNRLMDAGQSAAVFTPRVDTPQGDKYGYGFRVREIAGKRVVGHGGGFPGVNTELAVFLDSPYTVIVLSNFDPPIASQLAEYITSRIRP